MSKKDLLRILTTRSKVLHMPANEEIIFPLSSKTEDLIHKTIDTLRYNDGVYAKRGLAISAPQVGSLKRFFIMFDFTVAPLGRRVNIVCNPEILEYSDEKEDEYEGCLSIPKICCKVSRSKKVVVKYQDLTGETFKREFSDTFARIFQHECDHLNGVVMTEKSKETIPNPLYEKYLERRRREREKAKAQIAQTANSANTKINEDIKSM